MKNFAIIIIWDKKDGRSRLEKGYWIRKTLEYNLLRR